MSDKTDAAALELVKTIVSERAPWHFTYSASDNNHDYDVVVIRRDKQTKIAKRLDESRIFAGPSGEPCPSCGGSGRI